MRVQRHWTRFRCRSLRHSSGRRIDGDGKPLSFAHHTVATDADHTGAMNEALVTLAEAAGCRAASKR